MGGTVLWPAKQLMEHQFKFLIAPSDFASISEGNIHDVYNYVEWALAYLFNLRSADSGGEPSGCILFTRTKSRGTE